MDVTLPGPPVPSAAECYALREKQEAKRHVERQRRLAAALVLCAVDLPQPMPAMIKLVKDAARLCPGLTTDELRFGRAALLRAREIIDELLAGDAA